MGGYGSEDYFKGLDGGAGGRGEGRRSDLGLVVITGKASVYWTWSRPGSAQRGGAQPLQECVTGLGPHEQTLTCVANIE